MGLDMYLTKRTYVKNWDFMEDKEKHKITILKGGEPVKNIKPERISEVIEQVAYWRKANQIHAWFVKNIQKGNDDCGEYPVSAEAIKGLVEICKIILQNPEAAKDLLPTQSGFFFGSTDYGADYKEDLEITIAQLEPLLDESHSGDFYYRSSW